MTQALGIRIDDKILQQVDLIAEEEDDDRSTTIRKMLLKGIRERNREKARDAYIQGKTSFSGAASRAGMTILDFQEYLVKTGIVSSYSVQDLISETAQLGLSKNPKKR